MGEKSPIMKCAFDAETHTYTIDGRPVPSFTQVARDLIPGWSAGEWYMQRGTAVHACAAMIARGETFTCDPRIDGQVRACRRFFEEVRPIPLLIETPVYSLQYRYAGTLDLLCVIKGKYVVLDWKAQLTDAVPIQCAAYAIAATELCQWGMGVELHDDGTYKCSDDIYDLKRYKPEWLALLTTFNVRRRLRIPEHEHDS